MILCQKSCCSQTHRQHFFRYSVEESPLVRHIAKIMNNCLRFKPDTKDFFQYLHFHIGPTKNQSSFRLAIVLHLSHHTRPYLLATTQFQCSQLQSFPKIESLLIKNEFPFFLSSPYRTLQAKILFDSFIWPIRALSSLMRIFFRVISTVHSFILQWLRSGLWNVCSLPGYLGFRLICLGF